MYRQISPLPTGPKNAVKSFVPYVLWEYIRKKRIRYISSRFDMYRNFSYSQEGEDLILARALGKARLGFYVDVGAHHPMKYSNTYCFYRHGWNGINIDAMPGSMTEFCKKRPRDINLEIAISDKEEKREFFMFKSPSLNTFDTEIAKMRIKQGIALEGVVLITTVRLSDVLKKYRVKNIDFLSIDVEGLDLAVLQSNDWRSFRPRYVCAEVGGSTVKSGLQSDVAKFLDSQGYELLAKTFQTLIFGDGAGV